MRILYATDGSDGATAAGHFLAHLMLNTSDEVVLTAVGRSDEGPEACFAGPRAALASSGAAVRTAVREGPAADGILAAAAEERADLIAVGAIGETGLKRFLIGSVAERVLRHAEVPVLIARPPTHGLTRALVAVDRSDAAREVVRAARDLPLPAGTELRLVNVLPDEQALAGAMPLVWASLSRELDAILESATREAEEKLRELARPLQEAGRAVTAELLRGDPSRALIEEVRRAGADLLVVGSHGEGGVDRFLLGSVSERVARHAACSVLVVR